MDPPLREWLESVASVNVKILESTLTKLEDLEVFDVAELRVLCDLDGLSSFAPVTAEKIRRALGVSRESAAEMPRDEPSIFAAVGSAVVAVRMATRYAKKAPRLQQLHKMARPLLNKSPQAFEYTHELRMRADEEARTCSALMSEDSVLAAVKDAFDAHLPFFQEELKRRPGTFFTFGRGGCHKSGSGKHDTIQRGGVAVMRPTSYSGTHNTNHGCLPDGTRIMLMGECVETEFLGRNQGFKDDTGYSYGLLKKSEEKLIEVARAVLGDDKVSNDATDDRGREQYGPIRYVYGIVCNKERAAAVAAEHFAHVESSPKKRRRRD